MENNYNNENNNGILPIDLFNRFFGLGKKNKQRIIRQNDMLMGFPDIKHKEMNRMLRCIQRPINKCTKRTRKRI